MFTKGDLTAAFANTRDIIRLERPTGPRGVDAVPGNVSNRSRRSVGIDLKNPEAVELVLRRDEPNPFVVQLELQKTMNDLVGIIRNVAAAPALLQAVHKLRFLGYPEIVLVGHSAGGVISSGGIPSGTS